MANDSRRVSQLNITTTVSANDRVLVLTNPASNTPNTQTITFNNLGVLMANTFLPIANTTSRGVVKVDGVTINVSPNGALSAILAGNLTPGIVQPDGTTITINPNGVITSVGGTSSIIPTNNTFNLGNSSNHWNNLYLSGYLITNGSVPSTSKGSAGDLAGTFAANSTYLFYCTTNYTTGSPDIWKRISWSSDTW
jgi:hypothetical protein